ncbi:hypothetical protein FS749_012433, partial [Ceratobasidium sp. UAMH 11750]
MTGMEHRALAHSHLSIIADAPDKISQTTIAATRAALDLVYLSQLPIHTERSLAAYRQAYTDLMEHRWGWVKNETRRGKKKVINHFNIPKMHVMRHLDDHVRMKGSPDNFSTETMEHLHVDVKEAYQASNRREWKRQTIRWLTRRERMRDFEEWMRWCSAERAKNGEIGERAKSAKEIELDIEDAEAESESESEPELEVKSESETEAGDLGEANEEFGYGLEPKEPASGELADENWDESEEQDNDGYDSGQECEEGFWGYTHNGREGGPANTHDYVTRYVPTSSYKICRLKGKVWWRGKEKGEVGSGSIRALVERGPQESIQDTNHGHASRTATPISKAFVVDLPQLLRAINRSSYLSSLPITVDEYTLMDTWDALRTHLYSHTINPKAQMQRIRAKPVRGHLLAQCDPVFYTTDNADPSMVRLQ